MRRYTGIENGAIFMLPLLCVFKDEFDRLSAALERLVKFLWKWTKILSVCFGKALISLVKWIAKGFDSLCELISDKIVEAQKQHVDKKPPKTDVDDSADGHNIPVSDENSGEDRAEETEAEPVSPDIVTGRAEAP